MLQKVKNFIATHQLIDKSDKIALAISGGKDSVFAAHALSQMEVPFVMVHLNFKLRGEESDNDEKFVLNLGANLPMCQAVFTKSVDTQAYANQHKLNTQLAAREIRYAYFEKLYADGVYTKMITAHHQDDSIETFFINLNRGAGIRGLKSIPKKRDHYIRPFLALSQEEIIDYLKTNNIAHRQDASNASLKYERNKWRNVTLPKLYEEVPSLQQNVLHSVEQLQAENTLLDHLLDSVIDQLVYQIGKTQTIDKQKLVTYPQAGVILYRILDTYGFSYAQCLQIIDTNTTTGAIFRSATHTLFLDRETFILEPSTSEQIEEIEIPSTGKYSLGSSTITLSKTNQLVFVEDKNQETVSIPAELFPLTLRTWKAGDRIQPLGMKGSKLLSDFFIDQKINTPNKHKIPLVCKDDEVLWICGMRVSEKLRATEGADIYMLSIE